MVTEGNPVSALWEKIDEGPSVNGNAMICDMSNQVLKANEPVVNAIL